MAKFCTVINCIDGRVQSPVDQFLRKRFAADYVDTVTEAGIVLFLAEAAEGLREMIPEVVSAIKSVNISVDAHQSNQLAIVAHSGCAGNPIADEEQHLQLQKAVSFLRSHYPDLEVIGLWADIFGPPPVVSEFVAAR
ncbi:MAG: hypothetical protein HQ519_14630 [Planctomycetes bacterium]|nr:hypothetical protein [Planctomycetota bacterium]